MFLAIFMCSYALFTPANDKTLCHRKYIPSKSVCMWFICCFDLYSIRLLFVRKNCSIVCIVDVLLHIIRLQYIYQCFDLCAVLVAFLHCDYIYICLSSFRIALLVSKCILSYRETSSKCIVIPFNTTNAVSSTTLATCAASSSTIFTL